MSKPQSTQPIRTRPKAANASIMLFTDQRFCITPPYRITSPGTLIRPTNVAAVSCQALSPGFSQAGYGAHAAASTSFSPFGTQNRHATVPGGGRIQRSRKKKTPPGPKEPRGVVTPTPDGIGGSHEPSEPCGRRQARKPSNSRARGRYRVADAGRGTVGPRANAVQPAREARARGRRGAGGRGGGRGRRRVGDELRPPPAAGCISADVPSTMGGTRLEACGAKARAVCRTTPGGVENAIVAACRRVGYATESP